MFTAVVKNAWRAVRLYERAGRAVAFSNNFQASIAEKSSDLAAAPAPAKRDNNSHAARNDRGNQSAATLLGTLPAHPKIQTPAIFSAGR